MSEGQVEVRTLFDKGSPGRFSRLGSCGSVQSHLLWWACKLYCILISLMRYWEWVLWTDEGHAELCLQCLVEKTKHLFHYETWGWIHQAHLKSLTDYLKWHKLTVLTWPSCSWAKLHWKSVDRPQKSSNDLTELKDFWLAVFTGCDTGQTRCYQLLTVQVAPTFVADHFPFLLLIYCFLFLIWFEKSPQDWVCLGLMLACTMLPLYCFSMLVLFLMESSHIYNRTYLINPKSQMGFHSVLVCQTFEINLRLLSALSKWHLSLLFPPLLGTWSQVSVQLLSPRLLLETSSLHS